MAYTFVTFFPFMVCLFWTAVLALEWRDAYPAKRLLTVFMALCTTLYACHAVFFNSGGAHAVAAAAHDTYYNCALSWADVVYAFCNLSVFPLYYLYLLRLTDSSGLSWRRLLLLLPAATIAVWTALPRCFPNTDTAQDARILVVKIIFVLQILPICYFGLQHLKTFDRKIEDNYSNVDVRTVRPTRCFMQVLVVCSMCSGIVNIVGRDYFAANSALLIVPSFVFGALLFAIGYIGMKQQFCIDILEKEESLYTTAEENSSVEVISPDFIGENSLSETPSASESPSPTLLFEQLESLMRAKQLYLRPDLRLTDVALLLGVGRTTLSSLINQTVGVSFSEYVNTFRIRHAQHILATHPHAQSFSMLHISECCGFSTDRSFYRAFSKIEGMTPKQWVESHRHVE